MLAPMIDGPLSKYLSITGKTRDTFLAEVRSGVPAAVTVFTAESLYQALHDVIVAVEGLRD